MSWWQERWQGLGADVGCRIAAMADPSRFIYFVVVVMGIGGLGAWLRIGDFDLLRQNLATYSMGISAAAAVELVLPGKSVMAMRMLGLALGIIAVASALVTLQSEWLNAVWLAAVCGWLLWIFCNSENENIGEARPTDATGGDVNELAGDLKGFATD